MHPVRGLEVMVCSGLGATYSSQQLEMALNNLEKITDLREVSVELIEEELRELNDAVRHHLIRAHARARTHTLIACSVAAGLLRSSP